MYSKHVQRRSVLWFCCQTVESYDIFQISPQQPEFFLTNSWFPTLGYYFLAVFHISVLFICYVPDEHTAARLILTTKSTAAGLFSHYLCFFSLAAPKKNQPKIPRRYKRRPGHLPVTTCMLGSAPSPSCTRRVTEEGCVPPLT